MRGADKDSLEHLRNTVADFHENLLHCFVCEVVSEAAPGRTGPAVTAC